MSFATIKADIVTLLETVLSIKNVFNYGKNIFSAEISEYPIAVVSSDSLNTRIETNMGNQRVYVYNIWIIHEVEAVNLSTEQGILEAALDDVIALFEKDDNLSLSGSIEYLNPVKVEFFRADVGGSKVALWANLVLECNKLINIYSL